MDWQQIAALSIVGLTAATFALSRWRRWRQPKWARRAACLCPGATGCGTTPPRGLRIQSRKGDSRPTISEVR